MDFPKERVEDQGFKFVVGVDEAGRGPLAGPVVAAAVLLKTRQFQSPIKDSKKLSPKQREKAYLEIFEKAFVGIGKVEPDLIDKINILQATFFAMEKAIEEMAAKLVSAANMVNENEVCLLIDGNRFKTRLPYKYETVIKGDNFVLPIMCASIIAKVTRDRIMDEYDKIYPQYGFIKHKGYPTQFHKNAIKQFGLSEIHRKSFKFD